MYVSSFMMHRFGFTVARSTRLTDIVGCSSDQTDEAK